MKHGITWKLLLALSLGIFSSQAANRFIVRVNGGASVIQSACTVTGCTGVEGIDGSLGQVYLVTLPSYLDPNSALQLLNSAAGIINVEPDLVAQVTGSTNQIPPALQDNTPITYYGTTVIDGYVSQPATQIIRLAAVRTDYPRATGTGIVAVIDTGVDPNHPALQGVLLPGHDFTRNQDGADETQDITLTNPPIVNGVGVQWVSGNGTGALDGSTAAVVDGSTAAVVDGNTQYSDFGHGTMVAGIIHLVAPTAKILPIKVFQANGTGYTSDILRGIYYATALHANVLNMSFHLAAYSLEIAKALQYANLAGIIAVAASGNDGQQIQVYPASLGSVMGIASTTNTDQLSSFSNYGPQVTWVAAPGEGIVTTYPFSTYAAGWGTSFSTPFVSGTAAVLLSLNPLGNQNISSWAIAHAIYIGPQANYGRLDMYQVVQALLGQ